MSSRATPVLAPGSPRLDVPTGLARSTIFYYALPVLGVGFQWNMVSFYFLKFATDLLGMAPASVGGIFAAARVWDAVSDPVSGYWSDRTRTRLGRRRPWLLASAVPLAGFTVALWSPPAGLSENGLVVWVSVALVGLYTALTMFKVPHVSLGAELSSETHERTRIFAGATLAEAVGGLVGLAVLAGILAFELAMRPALAWLALCSSIVAAGLIAVSVSRLRERDGHLGRGPRTPWSALADFAANRHALVLVAMDLCQTLGLSVLVTSVPFVTEYLFGDPRSMPLFLAAFLVPTALCLPLWAVLSRRFGKRRVWMAARAAQALALLSLFHMVGRPGWQIGAVVAIAGALEGAGVLLRSLCADAIDWDERRTGERKEGAYFALWAVATKLAVALAVFAVGAVLQVSGFEAGAVQQGPSLLALRLLLSAVPASFLILGVLAACSFELDESAPPARALARSRRVALAD